MIDIKVIGSGSSGNCYLVNINNTKILLEAGLPFKKIQQAMKFKLRDIEACLITHEHMDHAKSVKDLMKAGVHCYMTKGTAETLKVVSHRLNCFSKDANDDYCWKFFNRLSVKPFKSIHDVKEPVSFFINDVHTKESLVFITDTAYLKYRIPDCDYLMIECNYIKSVLDEKIESGKINVSLRNRIVKNHMSLETLLEALKQANFKKLKKIYILHLSDRNSDERIILEEVQKATGVIVEVC